VTIYRESIELTTRGHGHMHNVTHSVIQIIKNSGVDEGLVNVFNVGSTGAIGMIEYEQGLEVDMPDTLDRLVPPSRDYGHEQTWHDGNGHSHLQTTLQGQSVTIPVGNNEPILGTWQQVFHLECDIKPRNRKIIVTVMGQ